jgi:hypothetical protein
MRVCRVHRPRGRGVPKPVPQNSRVGPIPLVRSDSVLIVKTVARDLHFRHEARRGEERREVTRREDGGLANAGAGRAPDFEGMEPVKPNG